MCYAFPDSEHKKTPSLFLLEQEGWTIFDVPKVKGNRLTLSVGPVKLQHKPQRSCLSSYIE